MTSFLYRPRAMFAASLFAVVVAGVSARASDEPAVTLGLDCSPLNEVVAQMTRQTGIPHRVESAGKRQLVVLYCKDEPASGVRRAIGDLLGWTWSRSDVGDRRGYLLVKPAALTREEARLRSRFWQQYTAILQGLIIVAQDPSLAPLDGGGAGLDFQVRTPSGGGTIRALGALPDAISARVLAGQPYVVRASAMPETFGSAVAQLLLTPEAGSMNLRPGDTVRLEVARDRTGRPSSLRFAVQRNGRVFLQFDTAHITMALHPDGDDGAAAAAELANQLKENPDLGKPMPARLPMQWPKPPEPPPSRIGWNLRDIGRRVSFPIIADCYPSAEEDVLGLPSPPWPSPANDGRPPHLALDELRLRMDYAWRMENKWLLVRNTQWYWEAVRPPSGASRASGP